MKSIRIIVLTCIYGRSDVTDTFISALYRFVARSPEWVQINAVFVVSNSDDWANIVVHTDYYDWMETTYSPNMPLGRKHNLGISFTHHMMQYDYIMQLGSDDLVSDEIWQYYEKPLQAGRKFFGLSDLYFYNAKTHAVKHYGSNQVFGACRMIHRDIVRQLVRDTGYVQLWTDEKNSALDRDSENNITKEIGFCNIRVLPVKTPKPMVIDIKTEENINKWDDLPPCRTINRLSPEFEEIMQRFPELNQYLPFTTEIATNDKQEV